MPKVSFKAIAERAGVGTATVERVLNGRGGVRPETAEKVVIAARALKLPRLLPEKHRGLVRIEVILVRPETPFFARLSRSFERIAATLDPSISVHRTFVTEADPKAIAAKIAAPAARRSGLIIAAPDHPAVRAALSALRQAKCPVVQIVTRMAGIDSDFVGIDNLAAGRMAGFLLASLQPASGTVVAMCHSQVYEVHRNRIRGFSDYMARQKDRFDFAEVCFSHDEPLEAVDQLQLAFRRYPALVGLYNVGGDNAVLSDVLRRSRRGRGVCFVGHELTEENAAALRDGSMQAVIDQAPETQARRAIDIMLHRLGLLRQPVDLRPIRFITVTAENI